MSAARHMCNLGADVRVRAHRLFLLEIIDFTENNHNIAPCVHDRNVS